MAALLPTATYRLQFHGHLGFAAAAKLVPYLARLGVSHLYASPVFTARPGSLHGYDMVDPTALDPALGTAEDFDRLVAALHENDMRLILDIVPNHLAADAVNPWWADVLENGRSSPYAAFFDIAWRDGTFLLPLLGATLRDCLRDGSLRLRLGSTGGDPAAPGLDKGIAFFLEYYDQRFPLNVGSWPALLGLDEGGAALDPSSVGGGQARQNGQAVGERGGPRERLERLLGDATGPAGRLGPVDVDTARAAKLGFARLYDTDASARGYVDGRLEVVGGGGSRVGRRVLLRAMKTVPYRLAAAELAAETLAYRRFFDINGLIGIREEDEEVFTHTHRLVFNLVAQGKADGLRVDHVDGLLDPLRYLDRLRTRLDRLRPGEVYIIVEKILGPEEALRPAWPVDGSTGYDFIDLMGHLFVDPRGLRDLGDIHARLVGHRTDFGALAYRSKRKVLFRLFHGEFRSLVGRLLGLLAGLDSASTPSAEELEDALAGITCSLPVYRTYIRDLHPHPADLALIREAVAAAKKSEAGHGAPSFSALSFVARILSLDASSPVVKARPEEALQLVLRWQQLTAPLAAKGVEDTALYLDTRLLSLAEVGSDPEMTDGAVSRLHERNRQMLHRWPGTLNAGSTHDAKRSEDVRARLDVLSEIPGEWERRLGDWLTQNRPWRGRLRGAAVPDPGEELLVYQTLVGIWPPGGMVPAREAIGGHRPALGRRMGAGRRATAAGGAVGIHFPLVSRRGGLGRPGCGIAG